MNKIYRRMKTKKMKMMNLARILMSVKGKLVNISWRKKQLQIVMGKKISNKYRNELKEFLKTVTDRFFSKFFPNRTMKTQNDYKENIKEVATKVRHLFFLLLIQKIVF